MPTETDQPRDDRLQPAELRAWMADLAEHPVEVESAWVPRHLPWNTDWNEDLLQLDGETQLPFWFLWAPICHPETGEHFSTDKRRAWLLWTLADELPAGVRYESPPERRRQLARCLCYLSHDHGAWWEWLYPDEGDLIGWG